MLLQHSHLESGNWRAWFRDGQTLEISWSCGWQQGLGLGVKIFSQDSYAHRSLWIGLVFIQFYIPLGIVRQEYEVGEEPSWYFNFSREFGMIFHWGVWRKAFDWPFHRINLGWEYLGKDGKWHDKFHIKCFERENSLRKTEIYPYRYILKSGMVQNVKAIISKERWIRGRHILSRLGLWPSRISYCINVEFDGEVGERSGSWKGGCIGCLYDMLPGETPVQTLRRMEKERKFR